MARYIDADELYKATQKRIAEANEARMAVVDDEFLDLINDAFTEDVAPRAEWISVEERLPGVSGRYICAVKDKNGHTWTVAGDYNLEMKKWFGLMFGEIKNTVTHWMPLPEPPKANP